MNSTVDELQKQIDKLVNEVETLKAEKYCSDLIEFDTNDRSDTNLPIEMCKKGSEDMINEMFDVFGTIEQPNLDIGSTMDEHHRENQQNDDLIQLEAGANEKDERPDGVVENVEMIDDNNGIDTDNEGEKSANDDDGRNETFEWTPID